VSDEDDDDARDDGPAAAMYCWAEVIVDCTDECFQSLLADFMECARRGWIKRIIIKARKRDNDDNGAEAPYVGMSVKATRRGREIGEAYSLGLIAGERDATPPSAPAQP
jgi:hypothetical protein